MLLLINVPMTSSCVRMISSRLSMFSLLCGILPVLCVSDGIARAEIVPLRAATPRSRRHAAAERSRRAVPARAARSARRCRCRRRPCRPSSRPAADIARLQREDRLQVFVGVAPAADQIADRGERGDPHGAAFRQLADAFVVHVGAVFDAVHARVQRVAHRLRAVDVCHDRHTVVVRAGDHAGDFLPLERRARDHAAVIEVDQAGDHDLDKVRPAGDCLADQGAVFAEAVKRPPDEAAVASLAADGKPGER